MRDVSDAYRWAQTLPQTVREEFKSVEAMVAAFIKTKRLNNPIHAESRHVAVAPPPETSRSAQDFQKALKDLQPELSQFDFTPPPQVHPMTVAGPTHVATPHAMAVANHAPAVTTPPTPIVEELDAKSKAIIKELKEALNLSTDMEAIRAAISLAQKQVKTILGL